MKLLYNLLAILLVLAAMPVFAYRFFREEGFGERLKQIFGMLPEESVAAVAGKSCIWLHAASVGEIVATSPIVKEIRREFPETPVLVSVVTTNGFAMAKRIIPEADSVIYFPLDLPCLCRNVLSKVRPRLFLLVETELWPNFLFAAKSLAVPVLMVNGRISDKSVIRYRYLRGILREMLASIVRFCMQSTIDAQYIIRLGANPRQVYVTGNTKFDQTYTDVSDQDRSGLVAGLGFGDRTPLIVAGSTHPGEEELLYDAFSRIKREHPAAGMILAPRDTMRAGELVSLALSRGFSAVARTGMAGTAGHDVVVLDTIGELGKIYSVGDVIYVGGSLVPQGGHNILEPAAHGKPILVGPHMFNFKDSYALLGGRDACGTVYDGAELGDKMLYLLAHDDVRKAMGENALAIIRENRGAAAKSLAHIKEVMRITTERQ